MAKRKTILESVRKTARGLHHAGLMSARTMREFDVLCLPRVKEYTAAQIKRIRENNGASQAVFAAYLNTSVSTVQKRERGKKKPNEPSLKLLSLVEAKGLQALAA
jgi:putative transcriptional regulator